MLTINSIEQHNDTHLSFKKNDTPVLILFDPNHLKNYLISNKIDINVDIESIIEYIEKSFVDYSIKKYSFNIKFEELDNIIHLSAIPIKDIYKEYKLINANDTKVFIGDSFMICIMEIDQYVSIFGSNFINSIKLNTHNKLFISLDNDSFSINSNIFEPIIEKSELDEKNHIESIIYDDSDFIDSIDPMDNNSLLFNYDIIQDDLELIEDI